MWTNYLKSVKVLQNQSFVCICLLSSSQTILLTICKSTLEDNCLTILLFIVVQAENSDQLNCQNTKPNCSKNTNYHSKLQCCNWYMQDHKNVEKIWLQIFHNS